MNVHDLWSDDDDDDLCDYDYGCDDDENDDEEILILTLMMMILMMNGIFEIYGNRIVGMETCYHDLCWCMQMALKNLFQDAAADA